MGKKYVTNLTYLPSGGSKVLKSDGVVSMLTTQAQKAAAKCNSIAHLRNSKIAPHYSVETKNVGFTIGALVVADNYQAVIDNLYHNTLKKGCGL